MAMKAPMCRVVSKRNTGETWPSNRTIVARTMGGPVMVWHFLRNGGAFAIIGGVLAPML